MVFTKKRRETTRVSDVDETLCFARRTNVLKYCIKLAALVKLLHAARPILDGGI